MARFNTISIETGTTEVSADGGTKSILLESPFLSRPSIYISPGTTESGQVDQGSATITSWNVNAYVSGVSNASGTWTFTINTEETLEPFSANKKVKIIWRAIGPVPAT